MWQASSPSDDVFATRHMPWELGSALLSFRFVMTTHENLEQLQRVGQYEIVDQIARGGMAVVYRARQRALNRTAALKRLELHGDDATMLARFMRESRVGAALEHANIVTVFDFFEHDGVPYIAMEYLSRGSLRPWIGRLSHPQVFGVLEGMLAGLAHAQEHRLAHRDLKPENVLLTRRGAVKIADFGIAKAYVNATSNLTAAGMALGTPTYMAPEQATASDVGPSTDLYALGVMAFEMLSGRTPFAADDNDPTAILFRHVHQPPPILTDVEPGIDDALSAWVGGLLAKSPADRPADAVEAWQTLEEIIVDLHGSYWRREAPIAPSRVSGDTLPDDVSPFSVRRASSEVGAAYVTVHPGGEPEADGPAPADKIPIGNDDAGELTRAPVRPPDAPVGRPPRRPVVSGPARQLFIAGPDATLEVRDDGTGAELSHVTRWQRPRTRRRRNRLHSQPARFDNHVDRAVEIDSLGRAVHQRRAVNVYGDRAIGKTHVLVEALYQSDARPRHGVIYLDGRGQSADDLLHAIFEELFACRMPVRDPRIERHLRHRTAIIAIEDVSLTGDELRRLIDGAPRSRFILTSRERVLWEGPGIKVAGMAAEHAPALAEQEIGRRLADEERAAAVEIAAALDGHPLRLRQAFSEARDHDASLAALKDQLGRPPLMQERLASLTDAEVRVARALAVYGGAAVGAEHLRAVIDDADLAPAIERLHERHDIAADNGRYRLVGALAHALPLSDDLTDEGSLAIAHFTEWLGSELANPDAVLEDMPAVLALIERAFLDGRSSEAIRLGRAAEGWLSSRQRWAAWGLVLAIILASARDLNDGVTEGWALNQLGTRSLGLGRTAEAQKLYRQALNVREGAGDTPGAAATRRNLEVIQRVPPPLFRATHSGPVMYGFAFLAAVVLVAMFGPFHAQTQSQGLPVIGKPVHLRIALTGTGDGVVRRRGDTGTCRGRGCIATVHGGAVVTLVAVPAKGSRFTGWHGPGCSGRGRCRITVTEDATVAARFTTDRRLASIALSIAGRGRVAAGTRRCSSSCRLRARAGRMLRLTAAPDRGWTFAGWSGGCAGRASCSVGGSHMRPVSARFVAVPQSLVDYVDIHLTHQGAGAGTVSTETGQRCSGDCEISVARDAQVTLTALPAAGSAFVAWSGISACATTQPCSFRADRSLTIGARYDRTPIAAAPVRLVVAHAGRGNVTIDGRSRGCDRGCDFAAGRQVTLRAAYDHATTTVDWRGTDCAGATCRIVVKRDRTVTAVFAARRFALRLSMDGAGRVTCGHAAGCSAAYPAGTVLTLHAKRQQGSTVRWSGCDTARGTTCVVRFDRIRTVVAHFAPPIRAITTVAAGDGAGGVTVDGRPCVRRCEFPSGTPVRVAATYDHASTTLRWSGITCERDACTVVVDRDIRAVATFARKQFALTLRTTGGGDIVCAGGTPCKSTYPYGTVVELRARPGADVLQGWSGCTPTGGATCSVMMTEARAVTARFLRPDVSLVARSVGRGNVRVNDGLNCVRGCRLRAGTDVTLRATYDADSHDVAWDRAGCAGRSARSRSSATPR